MSDSQELIKSVSIDNLLNQRQGILERFQQMQTLAAEIKQLTAALQFKFPPRFGWEYNGCKHPFTDEYRNEAENARKEYRQSIDALAWHFLMQESGHMALMDSKARQEWRESLEKDVPELTRENIAATFEALHGGRREMFNRGVLNVFKGLSWDYKTNSPFKFGKRLIMTYVWNERTSNHLDDLMRAFCVLDGIPEPDYPTSVGRQVQSHRWNHSMEPIVTPYFDIKVFKNNNGHLTFKRPDLVDKLNQILHVYYPFAIPQDNGGQRKAA